MGSWPEGVPLPPKPVRPEGVTEQEWQVYQNMDPQYIDPAIRDKVERAMGWKDNDVVDAREIAERVRGAVTIADSIAEVRAKGHVPEENLDRYRRILRIANQVGSLGGQVSGMGEYGDANLLWGLERKYHDKANELRVDLPRKEENNDHHD